jgi:DNA-binding transcriptional LysR family regulator
MEICSRIGNGYTKSHDIAIDYMNPHTLTLQQLAYLRELHRSTTVTAAANQLGVSQPALSQALAEIERRLNVPLFERRSRRLEFTEAGRRTVAFAEEVLGHAEALERWLAAYREGRVGSLRIGMIDAASLYVLPAAVRQFRHQHPDVELQLTVDRTAILLDQLRRSALDLAFVVGPVTEAFLADDFESTELREEPLYLYGPPDAKDPEIGDWVLYPAGRQTRALIDEGLARRAIRPRATLESDSPDVLRQLVALGLGWSVLPEGVAEAGPQPLRRFSDEPIAQRTLLALWRTGVDADPRVDAFLKLALGSNEPI